MKKALAAAALAGGLALVIGDTALGAVNLTTGHGGRGGEGGQGARAGDIFLRGFENNRGALHNTQRRSGQHAHPKKPDPQTSFGFDF